MAQSNLQMIRNTVRRITKSLDTSTLTDVQIDEYINTFVLYDFPLRLRLFNLLSTFEFYTQPYVDTYESTDPLVTTNVFHDFKNRFISVQAPLFCAGSNMNLVQSTEEFFNTWPMNANIQTIRVLGDGAEMSFTGTISNQQAQSPEAQQVLLRRSVLFNSIAVNNDPLTLIDEPVSATFGNLYIPGQAVPVYGDAVNADNNINYITGLFTITFTTAPGSGQNIYSQTVPVRPSLPRSLLFFDTKIVIRPVPDKVYKVTLTVEKQPVELLETSSVPFLSEWWQYIALGACKKVFRDRMDMESMNLIEPEFKEQEVMIESRTLVQQSTQKVPTIYDFQSSNNPFSNGNGFGGTGY